MKRAIIPRIIPKIKIAVIPWRNYALAWVCIFVGLWSFYRGDNDGGAKGVLAGLAIITLLDGFGKVLGAIDANRQSLDGMRGAIEAVLTRRKDRP
jgi:hypothetical protein